LNKFKQEAQNQQEIIKILLKEKEELANEVKLAKKAAQNNLAQEELERLYLPGEKEALTKDEFKIFTLLPRQTFTNDAESLHYRTAESQFHRLLAKQNSNSFAVTKVEYVVNPKLIREFNQKKT